MAKTNQLSNWDTIFARWIKKEVGCSANTEQVFNMGGDTAQQFNYEQGGQHKGVTAHVKCTKIPLYGYIL